MGLVHPATCILEADESTRMRMGNSIPHCDQDHIAGKGENSLQHYNLVHKFIPVPQAVKIPAAKAAVDKEWEKPETIPAWDLTKVRSKKEVIDDAKTKGATVHFTSLMDICHLRMSNWRQSTKNTNVDNAGRLRRIYFIDLNEVDIDFRIPRLPHSVLKQAENSRVCQLVKKIENHPHRQSLQRDLPQNKADNPFSTT